MLSKWCLTSGYVFYGLKTTLGLFTLDRLIFCLATCPRSAEHWHQDHAKPEVNSLLDWHVQRGVELLIDFTSPWGPTKNNIEVDWSSPHLLVVEMKNEMQTRHKGAQEIQRQSKGAGQSNVTTEFWSQLFPGFPVKGNLPTNTIHLPSRNDSFSQVSGDFRPQESMHRPAKALHPRDKSWVHQRGENLTLETTNCWWIWRYGAKPRFNPKTWITASGSSSSASMSLAYAKGALERIKKRCKFNTHFMKSRCLKKLCLWKNVRIMHVA